MAVKTESLCERQLTSIAENRLAQQFHVPRPNWTCAWAADDHLRAEIGVFSTAAFAAEGLQSSGSMNCAV